MSPNFLPPASCEFSLREKGKMAFVEGFFFEKAVFPFSRGKNRISQGVENWGSLISHISVPLALRGFKLLRRISYLSKTNVSRMQNAMKLGICSCKTSREKRREICREKFWAFSSFVS